MKRKSILKRAFNFAKRKVVTFYRKDLDILDVLGKIYGKFHKIIFLNIRSVNYLAEKRYDATSEYNRKYNSHGRRYRIIF